VGVLTALLISAELAIKEIESTNELAKIVVLRFIAVLRHIA
jgi:hypothetical protein